MPTFPRPYVNNAEMDTTIMHYVNDGDFAHTEVGSRRSGMPGGLKDTRMNIDHVSNRAISGPNWGGK